MPPRKRILVATAALLVVAAPLWATTWIDHEVVCPICGTTNLFKKPGSWGSYVYRHPARLEFVFWPATTEFFLYTCRQCHWTAYMDDFESVPEGKRSELVRLLDSLSVATPAPYHELSMELRLSIAEKIYPAFERDDAFWSEFYRVSGFHLAKEGRTEAALRARKESLARAETLIADDSKRGQRKQFLYIAAAMRHLTGDQAGARRDLDAARPLRFRAAEMEPGDSAGMNDLLDELIATLSARLQSKPAA